MSDYLIVRMHYELANIVLAVAFFRTKVEGFIEVTKLTSLTIRWSTECELRKV